MPKFSSVSHLTYALSKAPELALRVENGETVALIKAKAQSVSAMSYDFPGQEGAFLSY